MIAWRLVLRLILALAVLGIPAARADTPIALQNSWAGTVNFTGIEATMRTSATDFCAVVKKNQTLTKTLSTIPTGATVLAAYVYWAGSGATPDTAISFQNKQISAARKYTGSYVNGGTTYYYFGNVADVTATVKAKGNGVYSFGGMTVDNGGIYCATQGVLGGYAMLVVYSDPNQPFRVMNLYEGFQYTRNSTVTLNLSNFKVPTPLSAGITGRIGHITWEGDQSLSAQGETLAFNGTELTDAMNPSGNQFNSRSNIDGDNASYGIDFDAYTIGSPLIKAGDTTATTTYSSGQDLVWLNAEIVAVPNVATVDLALAMTRTGKPSSGAIVNYSLVVSNNGPNPETGPITVTNTLPPGMTYTAAGGTGWSCTFTAGNATASCSAAGPLAAGQALPAISISVKVDSSGLYTSFTNSATVTGAVFDNLQSNNTASDTSVDNSGKSTGYVLTTGICKTGNPVGSPASLCTPYAGPYTAATASVPLYITYVSAGVATVPSPNGKAVTKSMQFSLACINPGTGTVGASFAGATMPACGGGLSNAVSILFPDGESSGRMPNLSAPGFTYKDVGVINISIYDGTTSSSTGSAQFTSVPASVVFSSIVNASNVANTGSSASFFAKAGETITAYIKVQMADGNDAPNFGKEAGTYGPVGVAIQVPASTPASTVTSAALAKSGGLWPMQLTYDDLGMATLTATIAGKDSSYGAGTYFGYPILTTPQSVGNFYPGYLETVADSSLPCMARMACPANDLPTGEPVAISKAAYSKGPFMGTVKVLSLKGTDLTASVAKIGSFPPITLKFATTPGGADLPSVSISPATLNASALGTQQTLYATRPNGYQTSAPHPSPLPWDAPVSAYLRAEATFSRGSGDTVSSNRGSGNGSQERGVQLVQGRLQVNNANGSELLKLPIGYYAQYWTGSSWDNNVNDAFSVIDTGASPNATYSNCIKNLNVGGTCNTNVLKLSGGGKLNNGAGTVVLAAPGSGNFGSTQLTLKGSPAWLPVTVGQATFGVYRSPVIYIREVY